MTCRAIITPTGLAWFLVTILSALVITYSIFSPKWILAPEIDVYENGTVVGVSWPSVGIVSRCLRVEGKRSCALFILDGLATDPVVFPILWKLSFILFCLGLCIMLSTALAAAFSICIQSAFGKSIFTLTGTVQAMAGVFFVAALLSYAGGWGSDRVLRLCGPEAQPFYLGDCTLGWSSYSALAGTLLSMIAAAFAVKAERATSTDRVRRHVERGEVFVCLI